MEKKNFLGEPYTRRVVQLFEIGLDAADVYAYHGTSIEAITYLMMHGQMPVTGSNGSEFFYVPLMGRSTEGDLKHAKHYAEVNARMRYMTHRLPFTPSDLTEFSYIFTESDTLERFMIEAQINGMTRTDVFELIDQSVCRKGLVLSLSKRIISDHQKGAYVDADQESVITKGGLSIDYITGIEPCGQYEWEYLQQLQDRL